MKRTIQLLIDQVEDLTELKELNRVFCSAVRTSFNRLLEGENLKELIKQINRNFHLNKRYAEDAVLQARSIISSQKVLLPLRIEETQTKIQKTERKVEDYQTGKKIPKKVSLELCLTGLNNRLTKLRIKEGELLRHQASNTIPKVIFGGRKNFLARMKGDLSKQKWKALRSNTLYSRGDRSKKRNLNTRIVWDEQQNNFMLEVANPLISISKRAERMRFQLHIPEKRFHEVAKITLPQETFVKNANGKIKTIEYYEPYTIELKMKNEKCYVHLTYEVPTYGEELKYGKEIQSERIAGIDINIDKIAVSILTKEGRWLESKTFYCHEMEYVKSNRRSNIAGEMAKEVIDYLLSRNVGGFVLEDLNIKQTHDTNKKFNRLTVGFAYRKMHHALMMRGFKYGFKMKQVNPAHTSVIGRFKYSKMYGLSVHEAASFVIGRRGLGLEEKIPKEMIKALQQKVKPHLVATLGSMEESEKVSQSGKQKLKFLGMLLKNINHFKEQHNWKLWNVIHKTLCTKNQEILLQEV